MTPDLVTHSYNHAPENFTADELGWLPWLKPLQEADLTGSHWEGIVEASRAKSDHFMLLARDPEVLAARTRIESDIFYDAKGGLPRAERELAAAAVSRHNGCIFCASVHARFAMHHLKRHQEVQVLLEEGFPCPLTGRTGIVVTAAAGLAETPPSFDGKTIKALTAAGLDDADTVDLIHAAGFFSWANRLMLSLGEPASA